MGYDRGIDKRISSMSTERYTISLKQMRLRAEQWIPEVHQIIPHGKADLPNATAIQCRAPNEDQRRIAWLRMVINE